MKRLLLVLVAIMFHVGATAQIISTTFKGRYSTDVFDESATEIVVYDSATQRLFSTNGDKNRLDIISIADITSPVLIDSIALDSIGGGINSVAIYDGILALSVENTVKQNNGFIVFYDVNGNWLNKVTVGALPDMVTFTPDGTKVVVANEGEPNDDYDNDPEGSISIIDVSGGVASLAQVNVSTATFTSFNGTTLESSVRIFGPNASVAQDLEPEYITISPDSKTAYVTLQENNALAIVDLAKSTVTAIKGFGFKDHSLASNSLDANDKDEVANLKTFPNLFGMYQPDAITSFELNGTLYLVTANEGDSRDYDGFSEEERIKDVELDLADFPDAADLQENDGFGRLNITTTLGDHDGDGKYDSLYAYGTRSFSIWSANGELIYDSGNEFETRLSTGSFANYFNANNDDNDSKDSRSDNKGPEPEAVEVVVRGQRVFAFIGLERVGGVMVYEISNPASPSYITYFNSRNFSVDIEKDLANAGDSGPEDILFISAKDSPNGNDLLVVSNEVSGTLAHLSGQ